MTLNELALILLVLCFGIYLIIDGIKDNRKKRQEEDDE